MLQLRTALVLFTNRLTKVTLTSLITIDQQDPGGFDVKRKTLRIINNKVIMATSMLENILHVLCCVKSVQAWCTIRSLQGVLIIMLCLNSDTCKSILMQTSFQHELYRKHWHKTFKINDTWVSTACKGEMLHILSSCMPYATGTSLMVC
jgi:hypothetical protein